MRPDPPCQSAGRPGAGRRAARRPPRTFKNFLIPIYLRSVPSMSKAQSFAARFFSELKQQSSPLLDPDTQLIPTPVPTPAASSASSAVVPAGPPAFSPPMGQSPPPQQYHGYPPFVHSYPDPNYGSFQPYAGPSIPDPRMTYGGQPPYSYAPHGQQSIPPPFFYSGVPFGSATPFAAQAVAPTSASAATSVSAPATAKPPRKSASFTCREKDRPDGDQQMKASLLAGHLTALNLPKTAAGEIDLDHSTPGQRQALTVRTDVNHGWSHGMRFTRCLCTRCC